LLLNFHVLPLATDIIISLLERIFTPILFFLPCDCATFDGLKPDLPRNLGRLPCNEVKGGQNSNLRAFCGDSLPQVHAVVHDRKGNHMGIGYGNNEDPIALLSKAIIGGEIRAKRWIWGDHEERRINRLDWEGSRRQSGCWHLGAALDWKAVT
jgi:hypothetical protein